MKQYRLSDGTLVPAVGFGTYRAGEMAAALPLAVETGYRYFDTAAYYFNEELVGKTLKDSGLKREEYQIASKVWHTELGYDKTTASFMASLKRLDCGYLDVFLIHWPRTKDGPEDWQTPLLGSWKALIDLQKQGLVRSIGVSNFLPHHLKVLEETGVAPVLDQLECHPGYLQRSAVDYCKQNGILVQAWSPLGTSQSITGSPAARNRPGPRGEHCPDLSGLSAAKGFDGTAQSFLQRAVGGKPLPGGAGSVLSGIEADRSHAHYWMEWGEPGYFHPNLTARRYVKWN